MTMREAGQRVQPNLSRFTVASIIRTFREENRTQRRPPGGGRLRLLSEEQERELVNMVIANNVIRLQEIQRRVIEDDHLFRGINAISLSTIDRILRKNQFRMKQAYRVPFERNSDRVKNQRVEYVQRIFEIEGRPVPHEIIFVDEAGFNLTKRRKRGRNIIGHRAIVNVPEKTKADPWTGVSQQTQCRSPRGPRRRARRLHRHPAVPEQTTHQAQSPETQGPPPHLSRGPTEPRGPGHTKQMPGLTQYTPEHPALDRWTEGPPVRHEDPG
ncbi:uncharacterized protein LOC134621165 [Pelmatolapia mariae]|uniref:uncharacterized protein LOC134621165 n=1 Tax=Pelmatolapia mariae TaxID=158779 RepID=UPI002FE63407